MPSARRRRFSVHNEMIHRETAKSQNETQISQQDFDSQIKLTHKNHGNYGYSTCKNKIFPNTSKKSSCLEIVTECKSTTSTTSKQDNDALTSDKEVTASSSNIDLFTIFNSTNIASVHGVKENERNIKYSKKPDMGHIMRRDRTPRRDKYLHRIKVRSPKRKAPVIDKNKKRSIGTTSVNWNTETESNHEMQVQIVKELINVAENTEEEERFSNNSIEDMCRICHSGDGVSTELGHLISACSCRGTIGRVHVKCLERWLTESGKSRCELCGTKYVTRRVHRFGVLKALAMWIFSNNSKHMIVDFFGIMIMTPIAVVAAGLTGRTFAGLMNQDHLTPWPLASTFVLACMTLLGSKSQELFAFLSLQRDGPGTRTVNTWNPKKLRLSTAFQDLKRLEDLVCYYCWIVSALTRHALGWWIWYRSHYEVRLQLQENEE